MIKNIFIPERLGAYYLFSHRTAGIEIGPTHIYATVVMATGKKRIIEKVVDEPIALTNNAGNTATGNAAANSEGANPAGAVTPTTHDERVVQALKNLAAKLGPVDEIVCALPSTLVIFKELTLPFVGLKKIKMVVPFEVESLLPFSLDRATIDCIVTREDKEKGQSELLVAAVKNATVEQYVHYFSAAELPLDKLSVDIVELAGLYFKLAPEKEVTAALIDVETHITRIALIVDKQLRYIRALTKGIGTNHSAPSPEELVADIASSLLSAQQKFKGGERVEKVVIMGPQSENSSFVALCEEQLHSAVRLMQPKQLIHTGIAQSKITSLSQPMIVSIATALSLPLTADFNLQRQAAEQQEDRTITNQIIALAALALLIFATFSAYSFLRIRNLRNAVKTAENEALQELKKNFKLKPGQSATLEAANKAAANELKRQESAWRNLSEENRYAFLRYLTELSRCINVKDAHLDIASLTMKEDTIKLYGSVPGYQQLTKLQNQLSCPLFKKITKLQDPNFTSEPITLTINREEL